MGVDDRYLFIDGCVVKGCRAEIDFTHTFGEYADLLEELYRAGAGPRALPFAAWVPGHVHVAQSTQNLRTGAGRVAAMLAEIPGAPRIHLFGTSAGGAAILEYLLYTDPQALYAEARDPRRQHIPARRYTLDPRIASLCTVDAPVNWVPLRRAGAPWALRAEAPGAYLARHTRVRAGGGCPPEEATARMEEVPGTWVAGYALAGLPYDKHPHYTGLPRFPVERHIYTGSHMSRETGDFLRRVWA